MRFEVLWRNFIKHEKDNGEDENQVLHGCGTTNGLKRIYFCRVINTGDRPVADENIIKLKKLGLKLVSI